MASLPESAAGPRVVKDEHGTLSVAPGHAAQQVPEGTFPQQLPVQEGTTAATSSENN